MSTANGNAPTDPPYLAGFPGSANPVPCYTHDVINGVMFDNRSQLPDIADLGAKCNISLESDTIAAATTNFTAPSALVGWMGRLRINTAGALHYATPTSAGKHCPWWPVRLMPVYQHHGSLSAQNRQAARELRQQQIHGKRDPPVAQCWRRAGSYWDQQIRTTTWRLPGFHAGGVPKRFGSLTCWQCWVKQPAKWNSTRSLMAVGQATISDNIFLPSRMEIYGSVETAGHKGLQFQAYVEPRM